jgi:hypothetical protein
VLALRTEPSWLSDEAARRSRPVVAAHLPFGYAASDGKLFIYPALDELILLLEHRALNMVRDLRDEGVKRDEDYGEAGG